MGRVEGNIDELLIPLLDARGGAEADCRIAELIAEHADPVIRAVVLRKVRRFENRAGSEVDAEDVRGEVVLRLLARLRTFLSSPAENRIGDFRAYAAVTAHNACHEYLRRKFPRRWSLKNKLRYVMSHQPGLAIWENDQREWVCGLEEWRGRAESGGPLTDLPAQAREGKPAEGLAAILRARGGPMELDALTGWVAELWGVHDEAAPEPADLVPDPRADFATESEQRAFLEQLWAEIRKLPPRQRAALLLNLRDAQGAGAIELFPLTGVATMWEIAETLGMTAKEFATLWNDLPLEDRRIGERLGLTRQQVINLRKAARSRLARRLQY